MIANVTVKSTTLPANGSVPISQTGSKILFISNTGTFQFSIDGGAYQIGLSVLYLDFTAGLALNLSTGTPIPISQIVGTQFKEVLLKDTSGSANTITYYIGDGAASYVNPTPTNFQKDAPTYPRGNGGAGGNADLALAASGTDTYNGTDAATGKTRRYAVIRNTDVANIIDLTDSAGNRFTTLKVGDPPYTFIGNGTIKVVNRAASGTAYQILEQFYL
jgi:hypothetical protein